MRFDQLFPILVSTSLAGLLLAGCPTPSSDDDDATTGDDDDSTAEPVPAAPESLTASWNDGDDSVDLAWALPADPGSATGVLVAVSRDGELTDVPAAGTAYTAGDTLPNGATVLYVGADTALNDATPGSAFNFYSAWGVDAENDYSAEAATAQVDGTAPGAPTDLVAAWDDTDGVSLTWVNPADTDVAGVLVLGSFGVDLVDAPAAGETYSAGDTLGGGAVVVFAGSGTSASITAADAAAGYHDFMAWAWDEAGNWSAPSNGDYLYRPLPPETATLEVDFADPDNVVVTVTQQPTAWSLAATSRKLPAWTILEEHEEGELQLTAAASGTAGDGTGFELVDGGDGVALAVTEAGGTVTVTYDRHTHTAGEIADAINAEAAATTLMTAYAPIDGLRVSTTTTTLGDGSDSALRVFLEITNNSTRPTFATKAVVTALSTGTAAGRYEIDGVPAGGVTTRGLAIGETGQLSFDIEDFANATSPVTVTLQVREDPVVIVSGGWKESFVAVDSSGSGMEVEIGSEPTGFQGWDNDSRHRDGIIARDGRMMYLGHHEMPMVVGVDMTTFRPVMALDLDDGTGVGHVNSVTAGPNGDFIYAVVNYGTHAAAWEDSGVQGLNVCVESGDCRATAEQSDLVKIRLSDFTEVARVTLLTDSQNGLRGRRLAMDAAGTVGVVPLFRESAIAVVDLEAMTKTTTIDLSSLGKLPQEAAVSADGATAWVAFKDYDFNATVVPDLDSTNDGTLGVVDLAASTVTPLAPPTLSSENRPGFLERTPAGVIVYGRKNQSAGGAVSVYDPAGGTWTEVVFAPAIEGANGMEYPAKGALGYLYDKGASRIFVVDVSTGDLVRAIDSDQAGFGHKTLVTPF